MATHRSSVYPGHCRLYHSITFPILIKLVYLLIILSSTGNIKSSLAQTVTSFNVTDGSGKNQAIGCIGDARTDCNYAINQQSSNYAGMITLNDSINGCLMTNTMIDRENMTTSIITLKIARYCSGSAGADQIFDINIHVIDVNDNPPRFPLTHYSINISEGANVGADYHIGEAIDADPDHGPILYRIVDGNQDGHFTLTTKGSILYLQLITKLDRESRQQYQLNISATDSQQSQFVGYTTLFVYVSDINDNAPQFQQTSYQGDVSLTAAIGTLVVTVHAVDIDDGQFGRISYSFKTAQSDFNINATTGAITLLRQPTQNSYTIAVVASDHGQPSNTQQTIVSIKVINPNAITLSIAPFPSGQVAYVSENNVDKKALVAFIFTYYKSGDVEGPIVLNITAGNIGNVFQIENKPNPSLVWNVKPLDRENISSYQLTINASDSKHPNIMSSGILNIQVTDQNDHEPQFQRSSYSAILNQNTAPGAFVIQTPAYDNDTGTNSQLKYSILTGNDDLAFQIDQQGHIFVNQSSPVVFQVGQVRNFIIDAVEYATQQRFTATTQLTITIANSSVAFPTFNATHYHGYINESSPSSTYILTVYATMPQANGQLSYHLITSDNQPFQINAVTGVLRLKSSVDRESISTYTLTVYAKNININPSTISSTRVIITVMDTNDHRPVFQPQRYTANVFENKPAGTYLTRVIAYDQDQNNTINSQIRYQMLDNYQNRFRINSTTGVITTGKSLDREDSQGSPNYTLTIEAVDGLGLKSSTPATVAVAILDVSDSPVYFQQSQYHYSIQENAKIGSIVGQIQGRTADINATLIYQIIHGNTNSSFQLNTTTGIITVGQPLDREKWSLYTLTITVAHQQQPTQTNQTHAIITIQDVNDHGPIFLNSTHKVTIDEQIPVGQLIYTAKAVDYDIGPHAVITYQLLNNASGQFMIHQDGNVTLAQSLTIRPITTNSYWIVILAKDPQHQWPITSSSQLNLTIMVNRINHYKPYFTNYPMSSVSIAENATLNTILTTVTARDNDTGPDGKIHYKIAPHSNTHGVFKINVDNGQISLVKPLDHEHINQYNLTIIAIDSGTPTLNASIVVRVLVTDINDNKPLFNPTSYTVTITSTIPLGSYVVTVKATDPDRQSNNAIVYKIATSHGGVSKHFNISSTTGKIYYIVPFNFTVIQQYQLIVIAQDGTGNQAKSTSAIVNINVASRISSCSPNPCHNGGTCFLAGDWFRCQCTFGTHGDRCQYHSMGFQSLSYGILPSAQINQQPSTTTISISLSTLQSNALLLYTYSTQNSDYLAIQLIQGKVQFTFSLHNGNVTKLTTAKVINDGQWHRIKAYRMGSVSIYI